MQHAEPDCPIERPPPRLLTPLAEPVWSGFPRSLTSFFGRAEEIAQLQDLLRDPRRRLITLLGPGGVGKTRLAIAACEEMDDEFPDGAAFVSLVAASAADMAPAVVAAMLGVHGHPHQPITQSLITVLHGRKCLLVLDNLEHLVGPALREFIVELHDHCPHLTILSTSREPLRLQREQRLVVAPFRLPCQPETAQTASDLPAVRLFVDRARAVHHDFAVSGDDIATILDICRHLDGLPLAIELAAGWVRLFTLTALLERLDERLPLLTSGMADQPDRFRTMNATIAWSWDRLSPDEAELLRRLAVFRGGFTLEAATIVGLRAQRRDAATEVRALELTASLADRSLLTRGDFIGATPRFSLLETVREFALDQLTEAGELAESRRAHAHYYQSLTEDAAPRMFGPEEDYWLALFRAEQGNLRAAVAWGLAHDTEVTLRICGALYWFLTWFELQDGVVWLDEALRLPHAAPPQVASQAFYVAASLATLTGDNEATKTYSQQALAHAEAAGDRIAAGKALWMIAVPHVYAGDLVAGCDLLDRGLALMEAADSATDVTTAAYMHSSRGMFAHIAGNRALSLHHYERAAALVADAGSGCVTTIVLSDYAGVLLELGNVRRARPLLQEAAQKAGGLGPVWYKATALVGLALADALDGAAESAARRLGAVDAIVRNAGLAVPSFYQTRIDRAEELAKAHLGVHTFAAVFAVGANNTAEELAAMRDDTGAPATDAHARIAARKLGLTRRETEVFRLLIAGQADREIAASLFISVRTASKHVGAILQKLGVSSRSEAAVQGMKLGLA